MMRKAFTLIEVNLAIFIMAGGVLAMVSLYSLGMRESRQSTEDVAVAGYADAVFAPLVAKLSATNMTWQGWTSIGSTPSAGEASKVCDGLSQGGKGWSAYVQKVGSDSSGLYRINVSKGANGYVQDVFNAVNSAQVVSGTEKPTIVWPTALPADYYYGLVATRRGSIISLGFRASRRQNGLMSNPVYYTEVHYQGADNQ